MAFDTLSNTTSDTVTTRTTVDATAFLLAVYVAFLGIATPRLARVSLAALDRVQSDRTVGGALAFPGLHLLRRRVGPLGVRHRVRELTA